MMAYVPPPPLVRQVTAKLGSAPHYAGSSHDPVVARRLGFRGALIPGAFLYGYMSRIALDHWGRDWLAHGRLATRFRRPVYDGDVLDIYISPMRRDARGEAMDMVIRDAGGENAAVGGAGMPDAPPPPPDLNDWPVIPDATAQLPAFAAGALPAGYRVRTRNAAIDDEAFHRSLEDFGEDHPLYRAERIVHPGMLLRQAMGDTNRSASFPSPVILVSSETQSLGVAHVGDRFTTSGIVTAVYERKGNHYFESKELLIANGRTLVAQFHRCSIYAAPDRG
jgi:acyl dehydratase